MTTSTIRITEAFQNDLATVQATGKAVWVIIDNDHAVGAFAGREAAREAKKNDNLPGKIIKADEVTFELVAVTANNHPDADSVYGFETHGLIHCPHCGVHLSNGVGTNGDEVNLKKVWNEKYEFVCLACNGEFGPEVSVLHASTIDHPCKRVWHIADDMLTSHPGAKRKDVLAACVAVGIAYYTARTQYQQWLQVRKEMAEREARNAQK